jgi:hypothetical protein
MDRFGESAELTLDGSKSLLEQFLVLAIGERGMGAANLESDFRAQLQLCPLLSDKNVTGEILILVGAADWSFLHLDVPHEQLKQAFSGSVRREVFDLLRGKAFKQQLPD